MAFVHCYVVISSQLLISRAVLSTMQLSAKQYILAYFWHIKYGFVQMDQPFDIMERTRMSTSPKLEIDLRCSSPHEESQQDRRSRSQSPDRPLPMYDASRYCQVPPPSVSWTQSQLYEPTTLQSSIAPIGMAPGVSWLPYYNYPPYTPVPVNQYLLPAQVIPSQIIGKCTKAGLPGTREVADGLRLLAAQTELWESPVRRDRPVMSTSLSEPRSVTDGRNASPHHEYIEMATDDAGSSGTGHIQERRRFHRPWSTDPASMHNLQYQAETGFVVTERRRTYSKWFKRKRCRDIFCQTEDTLDIMTIDVVWLTVFGKIHETCSDQ